LKRPVAGSDRSEQEGQSGTGTSSVSKGKERFLAMPAIPPTSKLGKLRISAFVSGPPMSPHDA
jgi:hypothetical protein